MSARSSDELWALTSYFNPGGYQSRLRNYRAFRRHLDVPLVTVELANDRPFDLEPADADVLVQIACPDVLWHKERLLNVAFGRVPASCQRIAWFDCDVVVRTKGWTERVLEALDRYPIVQAYRELYDLPPGALPEHGPALDGVRARGSLAWKLATGEVPLDVLGMTGAAHRLGYSAGHVWAARREVLERHGFYDARILGGGDKVMFTAAYGRWDASVSAFAMNAAEREHYVRWARAYGEDLRDRVGFVDAAILHLWHGDVTQRGYKTRYRDFGRFEFDPRHDIAIDESGAWRWASEKPELHEYVARYMRSRREDGDPTPSG